jgi:hypothetical protein
MFSETVIEMNLGRISFWCVSIFQVIWLGSELDHHLVRREHDVGQ